jgi:hypothetical protein
MKSYYIPALSLAAALVLAPSSAVAQSASGSGQGAAHDHDTADASSQGAAMVKVVGCVQKERDVLETRGVGVGDEFVLTDVSQAEAAASGQKSSSSQPGTANMAAGDQPSGRMYTLTGDREDDMKSMVGKRVEITGRLEDGDDPEAAADASTASPPDAGPTDAETEPTGTTGTESADEDDAPATNTGSTIAKQPGYEGTRTPEERSGIEARRRAESLPRVDITSFREVEGSCQASGR